LEYINGIEYIDQFISDNSLVVLEILAYLKLVGSYDVIRKIIFDYDDGDIKNLLYFKKKAREGRGSIGDAKYLAKQRIDEYHKDYRVNTDDITSDIIHFLLRVDKNIFDLIIDEFCIEEEKKYWGQKYPSYSKCYFWDEREIGSKLRKIREENYTELSCDVMVWNELLKIGRHRGMKLEDLFKTAIIRFLEKRYDLAMKEINNIEIGHDKVWIME
jgi:hypothetical protein